MGLKFSRGSEIFSHGYFVGRKLFSTGYFVRSKFFLVDILWVTRKHISEEEK